MLNEIKQFIESKKTELRSLSDDIWNHPEVAYTEKYAAARAGEFLKSQGYEITIPYCGIETAFRCEFGSDEGPVFAFASEYDALPEKLRNVIDVRLKYQDASLLELCEAYQKNYGEAISKSGMKHRLNRIDSLAAHLEEQA